MILVLSGTSNGNALIGALRERGLPVVATAVSAYGAFLAGEAGAAEVLAGALDGRELADLARRRGCQALVDATHPFAVEASRNARRAAAELGIKYYRLARTTARLPESPHLHLVDNWEQAAELAGKLGEVIFLAVGTRALQRLTAAPALQGKRLIARVLPGLDSLTHCLELGFKPRDVVAAQGPFSRSWNAAMLEHFGAHVLVTKDSGPEGGTLEKVEAALGLNIQAIVLERPAEEGTMEAGEITEQLVRQFSPKGGE